MSEITLSEDTLNEVANKLYSAGIGTGSPNSEIKRVLGNNIFSLIRENSSNWNAIGSRCEVLTWQKDKPEKYFAYIHAQSPRNGIVVTWTGEHLGTCIFGHCWKSNMGDKRVSIRVNGNNGVEYTGVYYLSAGDYCHLRALKKSS